MFLWKEFENLKLRLEYFIFFIFIYLDFMGVASCWNY